MMYPPWLTMLLIGRNTCYNLQIKTVKSLRVKLISFDNESKCSLINFTHHISKLSTKLFNGTFLSLRFLFNSLPYRKDGEKQDKPYDACRVHGSFEVNKVAGNFHITAGK